MCRLTFCPEFIRKSNVYLTNQYGCDSLIVLSLNVFTPDTTRLYQRICTGEHYIIGDTSFNQSGLYFIELRNEAGCDSLIILDLDVTSRMESEIRVTLCENETYVLPNGSIATIPGVYIDSLISSGGCDSVLIIKIERKNRINYQPLNLSDVCVGSTLELSLPDSAVVTWYDSTRIIGNGPKFEVPNFGFGGFGIVMAKIELAGYCSRTDTFAIDVRECELLIPQGISPNNDNINDLFFIRGIQKYPNVKVNIFNRAGNLVFEQQPYENGFNGVANINFEGPLANGTYFYVVDLGDGLPPLTGFVYIKR